MIIGLFSISTYYYMMTISENDDDFEIASIDEF